MDYALVVSGVPATCASRDGDWNRDGRKDIADFDEFIADFLRGVADSDRDGATTSGDFFRFLDLFFTANE